MSQILPKNFTPEIIGATTSTALFLLYGVLVAFLLAKTPTNLTWGFLPTSPLAWFFMVWSPASYIFQSHHTEAIFLILSFFAFLACASQRFLTASIISGLCALTKNQGIFVAVSVGFWWALEGTFWRIKLRNFLLSGFISGIIFSIFPIYSFCKTGDFTAFYSAQSHWRPEMTAFSYVKALWFGNSWQNTNIGSIERYVLFWTLIFSVFSIWRKNRPLAFYVALFVGVMPLSGEFVGTFRYSSVLWPAWFCFAEQLASLSLRLRRFAIPFVVLLFLYINHQLTMNYGLERWSY